MGRDLNKAGRPLVPEMGGVGVMVGFAAGVILLITFLQEDVPGPMYYASIFAVLGCGVVGLFDDMFQLRHRTKALLPFMVSLPLGAVVYGSRDTTVLGFDLGILIIFVVPLGISSAANAANMLEGLNGLGAGTGIIMLAALIAFAFFQGNAQGMYLTFPLLGALVAFLWFNRYPAQVFPGDSMTLFVGATIAAAAIITHEKTFGALLFIPMIVEFLLKSRGHFRGENYGQLGSDGRLYYKGRVESLTHLLMKAHPMRETHVVFTLWSIQTAVAAAIILGALIL